MTMGVEGISKKLVIRSVFNVIENYFGIIY